MKRRGDGGVDVRDGSPEADCCHDWVVTQKNLFGKLRYQCILGRARGRAVDSDGKVVH